MEEVKETKEVGLVFGITANTQVGESILIVGEAEELGKWNPDKAVQLCTDHKSYPVWSSANPVWICPKPGRKRLEYKYLRDRRELGQGYVWEDDIPNRCLTLPPGGVWVLTDRLWNCPGELKIRPGSRHGSFESRRALVQPIDCDIGSSVPEHLFTPTQRKETREMTPSVTPEANSKKWASLGPFVYTSRLNCRTSRQVSEGFQKGI